MALKEILDKYMQQKAQVHTVSTGKAVIMSKRTKKAIRTSFTGSGVTFHIYWAIQA